MEIVDIENVLYEINKSKFLGFAYCVGSVDEVDAKISFVRSLHQKATHVCYAYVLESPNVEKCSDDGEPDGTAGRPILEIIKKSNLKNILIIVVRYFGGVKLGAGGLLRAYSTTAKNTIESTTTVEYRKVVRYTLAVNISDRPKLLRIVEKYSLDIVSQNYGENYVIVADLLDTQKQIEFECDAKKYQIVIQSKCEIKKRI